MNDVILELRRVSRTFGGLVAVDGVDLQVERGHIIAIIGPNGAGKTTLFNLVTGVYRVTSGQILFEGKPIDRLDPPTRAKRGIVRTSSTCSFFRIWTVLENVMTGVHAPVQLRVPRGGV